MRAEHQEMRAMLEHIGRELTAGTAGWATSFRRLKEILLTHNTKEERVLYPMANALAQKTGRNSALAERLRNALGEQGAGPS